MGLNNLSSYINLNTSGISVPAGYEAYGAWTELVTLPFSVDGLLVQIASDSGTNQAWAFGLGPPGSTAPDGNGFIQNMVLVYSTTDIIAPVYRFPIPLPAGAILYAQTGANGNEASQSLNTWAIPSGSLSRSEKGRFWTSAGFSFTAPNATLLTPIPIGTTVEFAAAPAVPIRRVRMDLSCYDPYELTIGYGVSSLTNTLFSPNLFNSSSTVVTSQELECHIPPGMNLYVQNLNTTSAGNPSVLMSYMV